MSSHVLQTLMFNLCSIQSLLKTNACEVQSRHSNTASVLFYSRILLTVVLKTFSLF